MKLDESTEVVGLDKTLIALFALVLVVGLAGGFILNYVIYQPQIQGLRNEVATLNKTIADNFTDYQAALDSLSTEIANLTAAKNDTSQDTNQSTSNTPVPDLVEMIGFQSLTATTDGENFTVSFSLKNVGTAPAALVLLYLNATSQQDVSELSSIVINGNVILKTEILAVSLRPSDTANGELSLDGGGRFASGDAVILAFQSVTNGYYQQTVVLP